ncbi:hypothetical protein [Cellulomonas sp. Y8]|uniref:hypothetical protein n=1 Tax=Cellulomonas sp. Y8 TaxID=2591145 RepID=UPI0011C783AE|nr:hypothetical protein [Cellulomonas sp. Y8]
MSTPRPRAAVQNARRVATAALSAVLALCATALPASARTGTFDDETGEPGLIATTDIARYSLRLDGSTAKATIYFAAWDPSVVDRYQYSAAIETTGDVRVEYQMIKLSVGNGSGNDGRTELLRPTGMDSEVVPGCPVTFTPSATSRSVSLSVAAECIGSPSAARVSVYAVPIFGAMETDSAPSDEYAYSPWVTAGPSGPDVPTLPVYRFWSPGFDNAHFFTTNPDEAARLTASDRNWVAEGQPFSAFAADGSTCAAGTTAVHRFYSMRFRSHFFTASAAEKNAIVAGDKNWAYEGVAYCATTTAQPGTTPLYRFWSPTFGKHHFTTDAAEARRLDVDDPSWDAEGIAYYVAP